MWCHFITQFRGGPICILYILKGRKSVNLAPQLDDGATLNSCNLKTTLNIAKLTRTRLTTFLSNHNCQVSYTSALQLLRTACRFFSDPNCTRATFSRLLQQHSTECATYIRRAAIALDVGPHFVLSYFFLRRRPTEVNLCVQLLRALAYSLHYVIFVAMLMCYLLQNVSFYMPVFQRVCRYMFRPWSSCQQY